jgi:hypothetical protein
MDWGLGVEIGEGVAKLVLVDRLRGYASVNDLAKDATHSGSSLQEEGTFAFRNEICSA